MIHPYMYYGIEAWFGASRSLINKICVLQKKSIRCIKSLPMCAHTSDHFNNLNILTLDKLYKFAVGVYMFRTINFQDFDTNLLSNLQSHDDVHLYETRNRYNLVVSRFSRTKSLSSLRYAGVKIWNEYPC